MVRLEEAVLARIEKFGERFEILVDPDLAMDLKKGKKVDFNDLLAIDKVFKSARSGEVQAEELTKKAFGTLDMQAIALAIISKGEVQLTVEQRKSFIEKKKKEVIEYIVRNALNPQTGAPHTPQRIEIALTELGVHIDPLRSKDEQLPDIIAKLKTILPLRIETLKVAVKIPASFSGRAINAMHLFNIQKQEWQNDGSVVILLEIPGGLKLELINKVNALTQGEASVKFLGENNE